MSVSTNKMILQNHSLNLRRHGQALRPQSQSTHPSPQIPLHTTLCDVCDPGAHDPHELADIAAGRWPGFVKPLLDANKHDMADSDSEGPFQPPSRSKCASAGYSTPAFFSPSTHSTPASKRHRLGNGKRTTSKPHQPSQKPWYPLTRKTWVSPPSHDYPNSLS